ncbi:hypothetical protein ACHAWO_006196 [Cyclotella atomus]|uniref:Dephospho-CoA kinase n=1 Tax=Cyclotella atomus TaxID=382360 RepID=A0ABD3N073_9STRA
MSSVNKIATLLLSSLGALTSTSPVQFATAFSSHPVATATPSVQRLQRSRIYNSIASEGEHMKILGVCGGIGSGKSTACKVMVDTLGCVGRIDADLLAHDVYEPGSQSLRDIVAEFGDNILGSDATIDRKKLGAIVFSDSNAMSRLEQIVWPHVRTKIEGRLSEIKDQHQKNNDGSQTHDIIIVEAALLLETNWHDLLDGLWVIQSSPSVAVRRLKDNRGLTEEEATTRINAQQKRRGIGNAEEPDKFQQDIEKGVVTSVITNDGTLEELQAALKQALLDPSSFKS